MDKHKMKFTGLKGTILIAALAIMILFYYGHLTKKNTSEENNPGTSSVVTNVLLRNLDTNYPSSPKEVVKYFSEVTKCFYIDGITDEDIVKLADKMLKIYDEELASAKEYDWYIGDLKKEIATNKSNGYKVSSYEISASTDVEYFTEDGHDCARLWCTYNVKNGKELVKLNEVFILRKDDNSHWRIFGWEQVNER